MQSSTTSSSSPPPPPSPFHHHPPKDCSRTLRTCLIATSLFSLLFILSSSSSSSPSPSSSTPQLSLNNSPPPPSVAYFLSGSDGDGPRLLRLVQALYHPRNHYLLHLDLSATHSERSRLALSLRSLRNVNVVGKPDFADPRSPSALASTLHGAAILLRYSANWDWFVSLSASHYPLVTQDDLLHILSFQPKEMNFVNHSSYIGWRESWRLKPIVVDPGLYLAEKSEVFYATQKRVLPNAYRLFTGSASAILSRKFIEFCILGSDNLPRTVLMYFSNTPSSQANYFQTVVCNSREFKNTVVNHNLQYSSSNELANREQHKLGPDDFNELIQSGAAFASEFTSDNPVLDRIDREVLNRKSGRIAPGGWCLGDADEDPCTVWGETYILRPGPGARRLERLMVKLLSNETSLSQRCIYE